MIDWGIPISSTIIPPRQPRYAPDLLRMNLVRADPESLSWRTCLLRPPAHQEGRNRMKRQVKKGARANGSDKPNLLEEAPMKNAVPSLMLRVAGTCLLIFGMALTLAVPALGADKPNIIMIWGDDIGYWNVSAYNQGMMGYRTPNIDRIRVRFGPGLPR